MVILLVVVVVVALVLLGVFHRPNIAAPCRRHLSTGVQLLLSVHTRQFVPPQQVLLGVVAGQRTVQKSVQESILRREHSVCS